MAKAVFFTPATEHERVAALEAHDAPAPLRQCHDEFVDRFLRERRLLARLTHPGIARLLDAGAHHGEPYLVMEYIDGMPITDWAGGNSPQLVQRIDLLLKVCRATEYAHGQLIVHRDIKPSNVMVSRAGEPALLDLAKRLL